MRCSETEQGDVTTLTSDWTGYSDHGFDSPPQSRTSSDVVTSRHFALSEHASHGSHGSDWFQYRNCCIVRFSEVRCVVGVLTSPSRSHRAKCVPCGPDLRGVRLVGGAYPFPNLPPLLSHRELCPRTAPAHLPAPPQRLPA